MTMQITLRQYGGFAPVARAPLTIDTANLAEEREEVEGLARTVSAQTLAPGMPYPDQMGYTLIIEGQGGRQEVHGSDEAGTPEFIRLVQLVRQRGEAIAAG